MPVLSTAAIRAHFPALERQFNGQPVAYFDGPGGTQIARSAAEAMTDYLYGHNANTHWEYASSRETDALLGQARSALADFLNCGANEVSFGANMTTLTFHLARAIGRGLGPDDEIVVTRLDHQANVGPWRAMAKERGCKVVEVPFAPATGRLDLDAMRSAINPATRWVACGAASNAIGTVSDVAAVAEMAHAQGARLFVDAVHYAPHFLVDVKAMGADALGCSPYKFYGPHMGVLYVDAELASALDVPRLVCGGSEPPELLETGTLSHEGMMGSAAAVDFLADLAEGPDRRGRLRASYAELHRRGESLLERLWGGLSEMEMDGVRIYGPRPGEPRTPTVGFTLHGIPAEKVTAHLSDNHGIFTSHGDFYATTVIEDLGLEPRGGLVRAGCSCYSTEEEVDRLVAGVAELVRG